jgi:hypothetical protein
MTGKPMYEAKKRNIALSITPSCETILENLVKNHNLPSLSEGVEHLAKGLIRTEEVQVQSMLYQVTGKISKKIKVHYAEKKKAVGWGMTSDAEKTYQELVQKYQLSSFCDCVELVIRGVIPIEENQEKRIKIAMKDGQIREIPHKSVLSFLGKNLELVKPISVPKKSLTRQKKPKETLLKIFDLKKPDIESQFLHELLGCEKVNEFVELDGIKSHFFDDVEDEHGLILWYTYDDAMKIIEKLA